MRSEIAEHSQCATKMIGIAMRDEQRVEGSDAPRPQGRRQHTGANVDSPTERRSAGIDQHRATVRSFDENRLPLPDIEHRQSQLRF